MKTRIRKLILAFLTITLVVTSFPFAVITTVEAAAMSATPSLIITELSVNASLTPSDPAEAFEFIEIKNTTGSSINLLNYAVKVYSTHDNPVAGTTASPLYTFTLPTKTIAAGALLVIWLQTTSTPTEYRTLAAFNTHFGTSLTSTQLLMLPVTSGNMSNTGFRKIAICNSSGTEICYAKYNEDTGNDSSVAGDATVNNSSIIYEYHSYPISGYKAMYKVAVNVPPTPAIIPTDKSLEITEICANAAYTSTDSTDMYEYVEILNTTASTINLKGYKLVYHQTDSTERDWNFPDTTDLNLAAGKRLVVWIYNSWCATAGLDADDFNAFFHTNFGADELYIMDPVGYNLANTSRRAVSICTDAGATISKASYNVSADGDASVNNSTIVYQKPIDGSTNMFLYAANQQPTPGEEYMLLSGQIHGHSTASDGSGTAWTTDSGGDGSPKDAYATVAATNADFFFLTDHSSYFNNSGDNRWTVGKQAAFAASVKNDFTGFYAYEMTYGPTTGWWGHINTLNTSWYNNQENTYSIANLPAYYNQLASDKESISQYNHVGASWGDFDDFNYWNSEIDGVMCLIETNLERALTANDSNHGGTGVAYAYIRALDMGWHVAPSCNNDAHSQNWYGTTTDTDIRTVVLATSSNKPAILDALRSRRVYAATDDGLKLRFTVNGNEMGSILNNVSSANVSITAYDTEAADTIKKISIMTTWGYVVYSSTYSSSDAFLDVTLDNTYPYYLVMVEETDGDWAISAPIWIENTDSGIFSTDLTASTDTDPCSIIGSFQNTSGAAISNATIAFYKSSISATNLISSNTYATIAAGATVTATMDSANWTPGAAGGTQLFYVKYSDSTTTVIKRVTESDLLITEIVANSPNDSAEGDDYEFIEIFNNTETPIDLAGYKIQVHTGCGSDASDYTDYDISSSFIAPPRTAVVVWFGMTSGKTVDNFLTAYGLGLNAENRAKVYAMTTDNLANASGARHINLMKDSGTVITRAWYNVGMQLNLDADSNPESIRYEYSNDGDYDMQYVGTSTACNPFAVSTGSGKQVVEAYYTVVYNANGGTGTQMENTTVSKGVSTNLRLNTYTNYGYSFSGWYAHRAYDNKYYGYASGSTTAAWLPAADIASYVVYNDGTTVANTSYCGTVTMYAIWTANTFTVHYNANGGTGTMADTVVTYGVWSDLRTNTFTRSGYTFGGWYAYRDYDNKYRGYASGSQTDAWLPAEQISTYYVYTDGCSVWKTAPYGNVTMYAIWIQN